MKEGMFQRYRREIAGVALASSLGTGALSAGEVFNSVHSKPTEQDIFNDVLPEYRIEKNSQEDQDTLPEYKIEKEKYGEGDVNFLYTEFTDFNVDPKLYQQIFAKKQKEYLQNKFEGNPTVERRYFKKVLEAEDFEEKKEIIIAAAQKHDVPPQLLLALCYHESGCQPNEVNKTSGATGYMQFLPETAQAYGLIVDPQEGVDERNDLAKSADAAAAYLSDLHKRFGQWGFVLSAYAGGAKKLSDRIRETFPDSFPDRRINQQIKRARQDIDTLLKQIKTYPSKRGAYLKSLRLRRQDLSSYIEQKKEVNKNLSQDLIDQGVNLATLASPEYGGLQDHGSIEYAFNVQILSDKLEEHAHTTDEEWQKNIDAYNERAENKREKRKRRKKNIASR